MTVYDQIGTGYDTTRKADPFITARLAAHLQIQEDQSYLDVACGTGNYTVEISVKHGGLWTGIDESSKMIAEARRKSDRVNWVLSPCESIAADDETFDGAICTLAIHHFASLDKAFREVFRVMRSGRFVIFTATPQQMQSYWLCEYFPQALKAAIKQMPSEQDVSESLRNAGFRICSTEKYEIRRDLRDFFLYSGKFNPEMYLDPIARSGISTFANLASPSEIQIGCERLSHDIKSGKIYEIQRKYEHDSGDYLFITTEKQNECHTNE
ncbi:MAG: class I SAM-dependent methyltransferase [Candidatus Melainabacteria bacterium]|nr:MAG: class I SAM-dependent methyltransferase [Candidatus Melainabacteria bacterium]